MEAIIDPVNRSWRTISDRLINGYGDDSITACYDYNPLSKHQLAAFELLKLPAEVRKTIEAMALGVLTQGKQLSLDHELSDSSHLDSSNSNTNRALTLTDLPFDVSHLILTFLQGEDRVCLALACKRTCSNVTAVSSMELSKTSDKPVCRYWPVDVHETASQHELIRRLGQGWFDRTKWRYCAACGRIRSLDPEYWDAKLGLNWSTDFAVAMALRQLPSVRIFLKKRKQWKAFVQEWCSPEQYQRARNHLQQAMSSQGNMTLDTDPQHCACHAFNNSICATVSAPTTTADRLASAEKTRATMATWCPTCACLDISHGGRMTSPASFNRRWWWQNRLGFAWAAWASERWRDMPEDWLGRLIIPWRRAEWPFIGAQAVRGRLRTLQVALPGRRVN
jgi:hypothetical protein